MSRLSAWLRWRRDLSRLERERSHVYIRWRLAIHAYHDTAVVFHGQPGLWLSAMRSMTDSGNEYTRLRDQVERMKELGP